MGGGGSTTVYDVCSKTMGGVGIALAMLGVIACPITSGDTAFRSARLVLADWFHIESHTLSPIQQALLVKLRQPLKGEELQVMNSILAQFALYWEYR